MTKAELEEKIKKLETEIKELKIAPKKEIYTLEELVEMAKKVAVKNRHIRLLHKF